MSTNKNDNNTMVILGASAIAVLGIIGLYSTMNDGYNEEDNEYDDEEDDCGYDDEQRRWEMERWESRNIPMVSESYCNSGNSVNMPPQPTTMPSTETYSPPPFQKPLEHFDPSPLGFSTMAGGSKEGYNFENNSGLSDYETLKSYDDGSQNIPIYNEQDGQIGLPVPDMSDISAGENNKYVYDRTIGTIGFTSTKIGGRRRGQADYIRGDLPIIPDRNTSFQVSADPINTLLEGAMNTSNGIGQTYANAADASNASQFGAQMSTRTFGKNKNLSAKDLNEKINGQRRANIKSSIRSRTAAANNGQTAPIPQQVLNTRANNEFEKLGFNSGSGGVLSQEDTLPGLTPMQTLKAVFQQQKIDDNNKGSSIY